MDKKQKYPEGTAVCLSNSSNHPFFYVNKALPFNDSFQYDLLDPYGHVYPRKLLEFELIPCVHQPVSMERNLMLYAIEGMRKVDLFGASLMRWNNFRINEKHISEVDFESLTPSELVSAFGRIVKRFSTLM